jgi:broad specificity phosphatase PhoE
MDGVHGLPIDLIIVRHGQSEGNIASKYEDQGVDDLRERIADKTVYDFRLTVDGVKQAKATGEWIRKNISSRFDRYYTSDLLRAKETAAHLGFESAEWLLETDIREQYLPDKSSASVDISLLRSVGVERFIDTLLRFHDQKVIVVCHATTIRSFMIRLEKLQYVNLSDVKKNPDLRVENCEVIWYSRRDPRTFSIESDLRWKTMIVPHKLPSITRKDLKWKQIVRPSFSNSDLLKDVERSSPLVITETDDDLERKYGAASVSSSRRRQLPKTFTIGSSVGSSSSFHNVDIDSLL